MSPDCTMHWNMNTKPLSLENAAVRDGHKHCPTLVRGPPILTPTLRNREGTNQHLLRPTFEVPPNAPIIEGLRLFHEGKQ